MVVQYSLSINTMHYNVIRGVTGARRRLAVRTIRYVTNCADNDSNAAKKTSRVSHAQD